MVKIYSGKKKPQKIHMNIVERTYSWRNIDIEKKYIEIVEKYWDGGKKNSVKIIFRLWWKIYIEGKIHSGKKYGDSGKYS